MQAFGRFVLSFVVALLAAIVVGLGSCASGFMLGTGNNSFVTSELGANIAMVLVFGAIPIGAIIFILVMIKMWHILNDKNNQQVEFKLPQKTTDQPPSDSEA